MRRHRHFAVESLEDRVALSATGHQVIAFDPAFSSSTEKASVLTNDIGVGDCSQKAGSFVDLQRANPLLTGGSDAVTVTWHATTHTSDTFWFFTDKWHQTFKFEKADGTTVATIKFDGPDMDEGPNYTFDRTGITHIDPAVWDQVTQVEWGYEC